MTSDFAVLWLNSCCVNALIAFELTWQAITVLRWPLLVDESFSTSYACLSFQLFTRTSVFALLNRVHSEGWNENKQATYVNWSQKLHGAKQFWRFHARKLARSFRKYVGSLRWKKVSSIMFLLFLSTGLKFQFFGTVIYYFVWESGVCLQHWRSYRFFSMTISIAIFAHSKVFVLESLSLCQNDMVYRTTVTKWFMLKMSTPSFNKT